MSEQLPEGTDTIITGAGTDDEDEDNTTTSTNAFDGDTVSEPAGGKAASGNQTSGAATGAFFERIEAFRSQGYDKAREYAVVGKDKTTATLDELLQTINDAAGQIDGKIGNQYGDYARKAAESLGGFNDALKGKDVDELFDDARALIAKAPAVAVGTAALLGFVIARLAKAGYEDATNKSKEA